MNRKLKILLLEDLPSDVDLICNVLKKGRINFTNLTVQTPDQFKTALKEFLPDIVLSDHSLPSFNSCDALDILHKTGLKIPFILITATISEEFAVDILKAGADDYILKDRLERLPAAVANALEKFRLQYERENFLGELIKSELRYRQIVETAQEGIWLIDENNKTTFVNTKMCEILGYSKEEMLGKENLYFVDDEQRQHALGIMDRKIKENADMRFITKSGKTIWTNLSANPIFDDTGKYQGTLAMVSDITEKRTLEELLNKATTMARIGSWEADVASQSLYWSLITREILELSSDVNGDFEKAINFYKAGKNREIVTEAVQAAIENNQSWDLELQIITAKGNEKWIRSIGEAEVINGKCIKLFGSFQDIHAAKTAEMEVLKAYEEKNVILESIGDAFFAADKNWIITYWNKEAEKILQTPKNKILGMYLWDVFSDSIDSDSYKKYHQAIDTNEVVVFEDHYPPLDKWYEISAYPSENGLSVYFKDTTERKQSELALKELNDNLLRYAKELAITNKELEDFAYAASHDLQEPLRMVTSFLSQLEKKYGDIIDEKGKTYIHFAVDGAKRMRQIILDLLEFSRVGHSMENELETVNLDELLNDVLSLYRKQIEETNAVIKTGDLPSLQSYKTPLHQVFQNLIGNALKYHENGTPPLIDISCEDKKGSWQFAIKDNGIGISNEYFETIFVIFKRLHPNNSYAGTGMGLSICKKIIEKMGGRIWVESQHGEGSTFYFTLPKKVR